MCGDWLSGGCFLKITYHVSAVNVNRFETTFVFVKIDVSLFDDVNILSIDEGCWCQR